MNISTNVGRAVLGIGGVVALAALVAPQVATAAPGGKGGSTSPSPTATATSTPTPTPTPTPTVSASAYFAEGKALNIDASATPVPVPVASTAAVAAGSYVVNATADFFDYAANSDGNLQAACVLQLKSGAQESIYAVQRIHTASDGSVALTWAFANVAAGDSIVLACVPGAEKSIQVSHSALTAIPVATITQ